MAKDKKSFILYTDLISTIDLLDNEQAGKLFKHILNYVNDNDPVIDNNDIALKLSFEPIKQQLKRDLVKYETKIGKRSNAGVLGNLKRYHIDLYNDVKDKNITLSEAKILASNRKTSQCDTKDSNVSQSLAKLADNDSVSDSVNVNDINIIYTQELFLKRWKDARMHYDKKETNITSLDAWENDNFEELILRGYSNLDFDKAMSGLFKNKTYQSVRLRPTHFLELKNFEKYLTAFNGNVDLFPKKTYTKDEL